MMKPAQLLDIYVQLYPAVAAVVALLVTQLLKFIIFYLKENRVDFKQMVASGGMPSSHAGMVSALTTAVGLQDGWTSTPFCISLIFSSIVMFDAAGVRQAAGKQAAVLNHIIEDLFERGRFHAQRLTEFIGHTPTEVIIGSLLGIGIAFTLYY